MFVPVSKDRGLRFTWLKEDEVRMARFRHRALSTVGGP